MDSRIYHIQSSALKPYVQYILFNFNEINTAEERIVSLPNTNICLGIINEQEIYSTGTLNRLRPFNSISSYLSGLYSKPHVFQLECPLDEICIDFTLRGYHRFFCSAPPVYLFYEDILGHFFGQQAKSFFHHIFQLDDFQLRGQGIEQFLLFSLRKTGTEIAFLRQLSTINNLDSVTKLSAELYCSERKLQRLFATYVGVSPKRYLRITRFRRTLKALTNRPESWESFAYQQHYYDYSHFIKDFRELAGCTPQQFVKRRQEIDETVTVFVMN